MNDVQRAEVVAALREAGMSHLFGWFTTWRCGCTDLERCTTELAAACPTHGVEQLGTLPCLDAPLVIAYGVRTAEAMSQMPAPRPERQEAR